jgi:hypothetical protein
MAPPAGRSQTDTKCPSCGRNTASGVYCAHCGAVLHPVGAERGGHFAAEPHQHLLTPSVVSTLFPHLPLRGHNTFRALLLTGILLMGSLALAGLFPVALIAAAVLVPLLVVLYLREVDLYEEEPIKVLALTVLWGAATGVGVGFLSDAVANSGAVLASQTTGHAVLWNGFLLPLIGLVVVLIGPLVLLPYRNFNDVLDGVTFGGAAAVTFAGAELLTHSSEFLAGGLAPVGLVAWWTLRVLTLGVAVPVLAAAAVGALAGALWLRFRAPQTDSRAHKLLAQPVLAVLFAAVLLVGSALLQLYVDPWGALAAVVALAIVALIWLRLLIHVGLIEEQTEGGRSGEHCTNCGRSVFRGAFCSYCGVAVRALPKAGREHGRKERGLLIGRFAVGLAVLVGAAVIVMALVEPGAYRGPCTAGRPCANPPQLTGAPGAGPKSHRLTRVWVSSLGLRVSYDATEWHVVSSSANELDVTLGSDLELAIQTSSQPTVSDAQLVANQLAFLRGRYPDLALDTAHPLLSASVGPVLGQGGFYAGHDAVNGRPVEVLIEAATQGDVSAVVSVWTSEQAQSSINGIASPFPVFVNADALLEGVHWPSTRGVLANE